MRQSSRSRVPMLALDPTTVECRVAMDNITHTLFGATLARTPLGRAGRGTAVALILSSNAPDIDIVATAGGGLKYLEWHRGPTHGPLGIIGLGLATAILVIGVRTLLDQRRSRAGQLDGGTRPGRPRREPAAGDAAGNDASFVTLAAVSTLGVLFHVLMDLPTSYGSHILSPFDWHWYAFDWLPILDIYLLGALAAGLIIGRRWPSARRRNAWLALGFMAANYGLRATSHERALALAPRVFGPALPRRCPDAAERWLVERWPLPAAGGPEDLAGRCLIETAALPDFVSPFRWRLIAKLSSGYLVRDVDLTRENLRQTESRDGAPWRLTRSYQNLWTPAVFQAAAANPARVFLGFSRFPLVRTSTAPDGVTTVSWSDMRFSTRRPGLRGSGGFEPDRERPAPNLFGATVRVDRDGRVLDARLGSGT